MEQVRQSDGIGWVSLAEPRASRLLVFLEAFAFAAFVAWYIWRLQFTRPYLWWILVAWLVLSFALHRDTPKTLGWRADNLSTAIRRSAPIFLVFILALCVAGWFLGGAHRAPVHLMPARFYGYFAFCMLQQVGLNSFLTNRFLTATDNSVLAALLAGSIFAALHWPNPVLVPLTLIGGVAMAWLFTEHRNILPLVLGQAILGALVSWAFPVAWHHFMRVGPGYYGFPH